jgi:ferredoxin
VDKITINIIDHRGEAHVILIRPDLALNLMEVVRDAGFQMGNCGGMALCASCHCVVTHTKLLSNKTEEEEDMLDQLHNSKIDSRLICQISISKELDGIVLELLND